MKVTVTGKFNPGVSTKDFILKLIGDVKADGADYMSVEFHGQGIADMSIAERMTICNMGVEFGAKNAVCKPDQKVLDAIKGKENTQTGSASGQTTTPSTRRKSITTWATSSPA